MSLSLIDDVFGLVAKNFSSVDDLIAAGSKGYRSGVDVGRRLARAPRLGQAQGIKTMRAMDDLAPVLNPEDYANMSNTLVDDILAKSRVGADARKQLAMQSGFDPNAMKVGEYIGNAQNAMGRGVEKMHGFVNSPVGMAATLAPDLLFMGLSMNQLAQLGDQDQLARLAAQGVPVEQLDNIGY